MTVLPINGTQKNRHKGGLHLTEKLALTECVKRSATIEKSTTNLPLLPHSFFAAAAFSRLSDIYVLSPFDAPKPSPATQGSARLMITDANLASLTLGIQFR